MPKPARVVELVDTQVSEACPRKGVEVQVLSRAPNEYLLIKNFKIHEKLNTAPSVSSQGIV